MISFENMNETNAKYIRRESDSPMWMRAERLYNCEQASAKKEEISKKIKHFMQHLF